MALVDSKAAVRSSITFLVITLVWVALFILMIATALSWATVTSPVGAPWLSAFFDLNKSMWCCAWGVEKGFT